MFPWWYRWWNFHWSSFRTLYPLRRIISSHRLKSVGFSTLLFRPRPMTQYVCSCNIHDCTVIPIICNTPLCPTHSDMHPTPYVTVRITCMSQCACSTSLWHAYSCHDPLRNVMILCAVPYINYCYGYAVHPLQCSILYVLSCINYLVISPHVETHYS